MIQKLISKKSIVCIGLNQIIIIRPIVLAIGLICIFKATPHKSVLVKMHIFAFGFCIILQKYKISIDLELTPRGIIISIQKIKQYAA